MRKLLIVASGVAAALAVAASAGAITAAPGHGGVRNGRIAVAHHTLLPDGSEPVDILTIEPDGSDPRMLTSAASGGAGGSAPAWDDRSVRIYFESEQAGNFHVFSMKADGRDIKQITDTDGWEFAPDASPDGRLLAFEHDNADFSSGGIFVGNKHGGGLADLRQLTASPALAVGGFDGDPTFSPDGKQVAFMRLVDLTPRAAQSAIFVVGVDGRGLRQLTPYSLNAGRPSWSPDGSRIAFHTNSENFPIQQQIDVVDVSSGAITQLTQDASPVQNFNPDWSPDGMKIVFDRWIGLSHFDLIVIDADGNKAKTIWSGADLTFDFRPAWGTRR